MKSMTYGTLPSFEEFEVQFQAECPNGKFMVTSGSLRTDPYEGEWTCEKLYEKIELSVNLWETADELGDMGERELESCSAVLQVLGFEWI